MSGRSRTSATNADAHDGLGLEVVDLRQHSTETGETESQEKGSEGDGRKTRVVVGGQDLDCYVVVVPDGIFLQRSCDMISAR